jgi:hypothetical protein
MEDRVTAIFHLLLSSYFRGTLELAMIVKSDIAYRTGLASSLSERQGGTQR